MSLDEAYSLAHTAQCRLHLATSRPDRNLRFVVGHLMHYESLRLRIVEIEHDVGRSARAKAVQSRSTGNVDHRLQHRLSTGELRRSPAPAPVVNEDVHNDDDDEDDNYPDGLDGDEEGGLSLMRFPSGSARPPHPPPELEPDDPNDDDDDEADEAVSPEEPDQATLERVVKGDGNELLTTMYKGVRDCSCHGETDAPRIERMWELPAGEGGEKEGRTRAVAQIAA